VEQSQKNPPMEEDEEELDKCSCGRYKYKADAACWICEEDAMDAEEDKRQ
jgi:hypothetical protein